MTSNQSNRTQTRAVVVASNRPGGAPVTQIDFARAGVITEAMRIVASKEGRDPEQIREAVAVGRVAIPANIHHESLSPEGVGTCVDGTGLSNSGKTHGFRAELIERSTAMIGTVPMYDAIGYLEKALVEITAQDFLEVVRAHAEDGVDFVTIHAGMNRRVIESFKETGRLTNIVSRGGSLIFAWMEATGKENPFYEHYDEVLSILHEHDVTISIGDAMRPGSTYDASDASQIAELIEIGKLTRRAWDAGVQVMVEGPGHMALDEIAANMKLQKRLCHDAPFYVLGPLVTDIAPGYDHITAAIGGAVAASSGADFLCYVTPAEHLRLPDADDVREGLVATKIAAHAADMVKGVPGARDRDNRMSDARRRVDWDEMFSYALDPVKARRYFESAPPSNEGTCTMCGKMCAMRTVNQIMDGFTIDLDAD